MSLDVDGFTNEIDGGDVIIRVDKNHRLLKLARQLPWDEMLTLIMPDLQRTDKRYWWMGRPLRVRIHLAVYILQQMFDLTDRFVEQQVRDNAAFRLFCGYGFLKKWHVPDHTKIEAFRSRLSPETQRHLANLICQQAVRLGYANPTQMDIDSTIQEANISYPAMVNWKCNNLSVICNMVSFMLMHLKPLFSIYRPILYYGLPREVVARD